ncbi:MAG: DUF1570 domain-containing protein [Planctomycetales bacterium]|nr:DUF1570 domain-containing protein [Planctomycetales bacterium]
MYFDIKDPGTSIKKVPTVQEQFSKQLGRAGGDADKRYEAAQWALRHGLLQSFYSTVDKTLEANPNHVRANMVKKLKVRMDEPIADSAKQEKELRDLVGRPDMKIKVSKHFVLLHDTPDKPVGNRKIRSDERLQLLEQVYESFLLKFFANGVELEIPKERLKVVLFAEHQDYLFFATKLNPGLSSAAGFWSPTTNASVFYDNGTTEDFKQLLELSDALQKEKADAVKSRAANAADIRRLADTLQFIVNLERENLDIEVVSHETTHQMAGNTGLLPRDVRVPSWVHEGLATYFETPEGANWGGIGAVNSDRLKWYRALEPDKEHSNIDFIVGDQIFDYAGNHASKVHGYGQAWALTHFLMERHFEEFIAFYRRLGELPPEVQFSQEVLTTVFNEAIKKDRRQLDTEWRSYMRGLKTDLDVILDDR